MRVDSARVRKKFRCVRFSIDRVRTHAYTSPITPPALSVANAPTPALSIIQREIIDTAIKVRDANSVGLPTVARDKKIQLFALLRVRRAMREAVA